jgi:hypothetical protein
MWCHSAQLVATGWSFSWILLKGRAPCSSEAMTGQVGNKSIKPQTITQQEQNGPHSLSRRTSAPWVLPLLTAISPTASPHPTNLASRDKLQHGSPLWMAKVKINISCSLFATRYAQGASGETVRYLKPGVRHSAEFRSFGFGFGSSPGSGDFSVGLLRWA